MAATPAQGVQRKVGFEFEDSGWSPWRRDRKGAFKPDLVQPVKRKEWIHVGSDFKLEADDTLGEDYPDIEFVTEPFEETDAGLHAFDQALQEISDVYTRFGQNAGKPGPDKTKTKPWKFKKANFVGHDQHKLGGGQFAQKDVLISGPNTDRGIKMQATTGVPLEHMASVMEHIGVAPGENKKQKRRRGGVRKTVWGKKDPTGNQIAETIGSAPTLARSVLGLLQGDGALSTRRKKALNTNPDKLVGFLALVIMYIKQLQYPDKTVVKYRIPLLGRSNFAVMFKDLPSGQRETLRDKADIVLNHLLAVSNGSPTIKIQGRNLDDALTAASPLIRVPKTAGLNPGETVDIPDWAPLRQLSIADWMHGIVSGTDYLTPEGIDSFLGPAGKNVADDARKIAVGKLESVGQSALPRGMDKRGKTKLALFENRAMTPLGADKKMTIADARTAARAYLEAFKKVRENA